MPPDPKPGDPGYLDWLIEKATGKPPVATATPPPVPAAPQPTGGRTATPSAAPASTASTRTPFPTSAENEQTRYNDRLAAGREGGYLPQSVLQSEAVRLPNGTYVNTRTGEQWNPLASTAKGEPLFQKDTFGASRTEIAQAQAIARTQGTASTATPNPAAPVRGLPAPAAPAQQATSGAFLPNQQALDAARATAPGGYLPGQLTNLDRGLQRLDPETARPPSSFRGELNQYDEMTRGGPGRAGFTPIAYALDTTAGGRGVFGGLPGSKAAAPYTPNLFRDSTLLMDEGYGPERGGGRDFYSRGEPSVATTYQGSAATLSPGTAGGEIRGGAAGGFGFDAGAFLGSHGIAPSGDPMVDAARAAEIAQDMGLYSAEGPANANTGNTELFAYGGSVGYTGGEVPWYMSQLAPGMYQPGNVGPDFGPYGINHPANQGRLPDQIEGERGWLAAQPTQYNFRGIAGMLADQRANMSRNARLGLQPQRAIQLEPGEIPSDIPLPTGFYYRPNDVTIQDWRTKANEAAALESRKTIQGPGQRGQPPNQIPPRFAYGGDVSVMPQGGGRKSMMVEEPSAIVGMNTGTPYGIMGEAGAEVLTDVGNRLRIDPISRPTNFRSPLALGIAVSAANGLKSFR